MLAGGACDVGTNLGLSGIDYALTGAAGATLVAPFVTAVPVAEVWVNATAAPEELYDAAKADPVNDGQNVVFLQAKNDAPLIFREMTEGLWVANRFRLYADLRRDPSRRPRAGRTSARGGDRVLSPWEHHSDYNEATTERCERTLVILLGDLGP